MIINYAYVLSAVFLGEPGLADPHTLWFLVPLGPEMVRKRTFEKQYRFYGPSFTGYG